MKRNLLKRIGAVSLAVAVSLTMGTAAFAADATATGDYTADNETKTVLDGNSITLAKTIVYFNPDGDYTMRGPSVNYSYTIAPVTGLSGVTVTDSSGKSASVKDGDTDGVASSATISFVPEDTSKGGTKGTPVTKTGSITVTPANFPSAGIYRYSITETTDPSSAGVTNATDTNADTRYMDVYINNSNGGLVLAGATIFKNTGSINGDSNSGTVTEGKTIGFDVKTVSSDTDYKDDATVDKYYTYNLEVSKTIEGSLADMTHNFPFVITLTNAVADVTVDPSLTNTSRNATSDKTEATALSSGALTINATLSNQDKVVIMGLPNSTKAAIAETDDTSDTYTATVSGLVTTITPSGKVWSTTATEITDKDANTTIDVTNTLDEVSPTNVVMRFAPYLFILGAAIVLLVLMRRRKAHNEAE